MDGGTILHVHIPGGGFVNGRRQVGFLSASIFFKTSNEQLYLFISTTLVVGLVTMCARRTRGSGLTCDGRRTTRILYV